MSQLTVAPGRSTRARRATGAPRPATAVRRGAVVERTTTARLAKVSAPAQTRAVGAGFVAFCLLALVGGLVGLLLLNTQRAQQSFTLDRLQSRTATLSATQESLDAQLDSVSAPQQLALKAQALGLVPATNVRYVDAKGATVGVAKGDGKSAPFTVGTLPSTPASRAASVAAVAVTQGVQLPAPAPAATASPSASATAGASAKPSVSPTSAASPGATAKATTAPSVKAAAPTAKASTQPTAKATPSPTK